MQTETKKIYVRREIKFLIKFVQIDDGIIKIEIIGYSKL